MQRYKLVVEYFGHGFHGWQAQRCSPYVPTIQSHLERAVEKFAGKGNASEVVTSSRTDAGVHALANVCHVDIQRVNRKTGNVVDPHDPVDVKKAINYLLGENSRIFVKDVQMVSSDFHARFHAIGRKYVYRILCKRSGKPHIRNSRQTSRVFQDWTAWHLDYPLDVDEMLEGSQYLLGKHDFSSFRGASCQANSPIKRVTSIDVQSYCLRSILPPEVILSSSEFDLIQVTISAESFLYHMVRNIVGALHEVGKHKLQHQDIDHILKRRSRRAAPLMAPAHGLYLTNSTLHYTMTDTKAQNMKEFVSLYRTLRPSGPNEAWEFQ